MAAGVKIAVDTKIAVNTLTPSSGANSIPFINAYEDLTRWPDFF
jgi:hypothetical protein